MSLHLAKMTSKGQITIPSELRKEIGLEKGDEVEFFKEDGRVYLARRLEGIEAAFGICKAPRGASLEEMEEAIQEGAKS